MGAGCEDPAGKHPDQIMSDPLLDESVRGSQPGQRDRDEPAGRDLGRQAASCGEGVKAIACELVRRDIFPEVTGLCDLGQQISDQVDELLLRSGDVLTSMHKCREFGTMLLTVMADERVGLQHSFEPLASVTGMIAEFGEMFEVAGDMTLVPGDQDRLDV